MNSQFVNVQSSFLKKIVSSPKTIPSFKTWSRSTLIIPKFVGLRLKVHNGKDFIPLVISNEMIGYKLGEFVLTRSKYEFKKKRKKK